MRWKDRVSPKLAIVVIAATLLALALAVRACSVPDPLASISCPVNMAIKS
jgi:hypothetical protein